VIFDAPDVAELERDAPFWALYEDAFPPNEREPRAVITGSVASGAGLAVRARDPGTIGLATLHLLRDPPAPFLVYLAVARERRGAGVGGPLLERALALGAERLGAAGLSPRGCVWEVEDPAATQDPAARARRQKRIAWFERQGGRILPVRYRQPPVDGIAPVPMLLMERPPGAFSDGRAVARAITFEKYGGANGIARPTLERLLAEAEGPWA
jgi:hypothetical protein